MPATAIQLLLGLLLGVAGGRLDASAAAAATAASDLVLLKVRVTRNGETVSHPGHMTELGNESVLVLTLGDHTHEVEVMLEPASGGTFKAEVAYQADGRRVFSRTVKAPGREWTKVKSKDGKSVVSLFVDPGATRTDPVEIPDGQGPLDGVR